MLGSLAFVAFLAAWWFGETLILRHIKAIIESAKQIKEGNLGARIGKPYASGELGELGGTFDLMGEALEQRQKELRDSHERWRSLVETSSGWVWELDCDLRYVWASAKVSSILGYDPEEIIGKTPFDVMLSD